MAIAKMQKFSLLTFIDQKDRLLQQLQDFQHVELTNAADFYDSSEFSNLFSEIKEQQLQETLEEQLGKTAWALHFLADFVEKPGFLQKLRTPVKQYTLQELKQHTDTYPWEATYQKLKQLDKKLRLAEQERKELSLQEDELNIWRYFQERPAVLESFNQAQGLLGSIPNSELPQLVTDIEKYSLAYIETIYHSQTNTYLLVLYHKDIKEKTAALLRKSGFDAYHYPFEGVPEADLQEVKNARKKIAEKEKALRAELKNMSHDREALNLVAEYLDSALTRLQQGELLQKSRYAASVTGWVPAEQTAGLIRKIEKIVGQEYYLELHETKEAQLAEIPILLKNNALIKPFEGLVEMYSMPQYDELDPTPFMAPFYMLAFGMMVADFGYGLLLFLAIFFAKKVFHFKPKMLQNLTLFEICAVPTMLWGLIYGNVFGFEFSFQLLSASEDVNEILVISIIFGYLQIMFGLILKFYILWAKKEQKLQAVFKAGSWMAFLLSVLVLVVGMLLLPASPLQTIGLIGIILSLVAAVIGGTFEGQTLAGKFGTGLYALMDVTKYVGDMISFTRLMALGVAGGSIAAAFNLIISYLPPVARFTVGVVLFLALHALNIFLSYLSAYVHGIRLQYLEYFGKFFTGGGRAFQPFKANEKYTEVVSEETRNQQEESK